MLKSRILSLSFQNIRSFGENVFHAPPKNNQGRHTNWPINKMIILQMPNGTAKTTIIDLVNLAYTGRVPDAKTASSFKRLNGSKKGNSDETSMFKIRMEINEDVYAFTLFLNHENKDYYWETTNKENSKRGWHPPREFKEIFEDKSELARLFIMDLETRDSILKESGKSLIKDAIREFGGLASTYRLIGQPYMGQFSGGTVGGIKEFLEEKIGTIGDNAEKSRIEIRDKKTREELNERIEKVNHQVKTLNGERNEILIKLNGDQNEKGLNEELKVLENKHDKGAEDRTKWKTEILRIEGRIEEEAERLEKILINPRTAYNKDWEIMKKFHEIHDKSGLPGPVGQQFIKKIISEKVCICGTEIEKYHRDYMNNNIDQWIDKNQITAVTNMQHNMAKDDSNDYKREVDFISDIIVSLKDDLINATSEYDKSYQNQGEKQRREDLRQKINDLSDRLEKIDKQLLIRETTNKIDLISFNEHQNGLDNNGKVPEKPDWNSYNLSQCQNLPILYENLEVLKKKMEDSSEHKQTFNGLRTFRDIIGKALLKVTDDLSYKINRDAAAMWKKSPSVIAESEDFSVSYMGENVQFLRGDPPVDIGPGGASGAQKLMACYSLSVALTKNGHISMPFIGDTPYTGVDVDGQHSLAQDINAIFPQSLFLINTQEKLAFNHNLIEKWATKSTHRILIWSPVKDSDGGKLCKYSEDIDFWKNFTGNTEEIGGGN